MTELLSIILIFGLVIAYVLGIRPEVKRKKLVKDHYEGKK